MSVKTTLKVEVGPDDYSDTSWLGELTNHPDWTKVYIDISHPENPYYSLHCKTGCQYFISAKHSWADSNHQSIAHYQKHERKAVLLKWARQDLELLNNYHIGETWDNVITVWVELEKDGWMKDVESQHNVLRGVASNGDNSYFIEIVRDLLPDGYTFTDDEILEALNL